ncbi:MAG: polyprenyl synthetase family protein [Spirochaetes bacterium]|nr:polyprenyl synthetase family protein [Spirochaetota bacterium]
MKTFFSKKRQLIGKYLIQFFKKKVKKLKINRWGQDVIQRFEHFARQGKMIRGLLVILSYSMYKNRLDHNAVAVASAMELLHSSFLIHDDIMDKDLLRRGLKTIFHQYSELGKSEHFNQAYHFGESMGICAGDIGFFFSWEILSNLKLKSNIKDTILNYWAQENQYVGLAQMQDVYLGLSHKKIEEKDILDLYRYKTARYTFSLPLALGALMAGQKKNTVTRLEKIGENLGIIFQIQDDYLGLCGDVKITGKPVGSDIKEKKKTLYYLTLMEKVNKTEKEKLENIFGNPDITIPMIGFVQKLIEKYKIDSFIFHKMKVLSQKTAILITSLNIARKYKKILIELLEYSLARKK